MPTDARSADFASKRVPFRVGEGNSVVASIIKSEPRWAAIGQVLLERDTC